ncbi:tyrosine-type recombinase/integrase [Fredinandcohnia humi]
MMLQITTMNNQLEYLISNQSSIMESLQAMKEYRQWTESTFYSYLKDVEVLEKFSDEHHLNLNLGNVRLHIVQKWIKWQQFNNAASSTIKRRMACLSSIFDFYKSLGIVNSNPFKAISIPDGFSSHHSPVMNIEQLKKVYLQIKDLKLKGVDIEVTVKVMLMTGLRNEALTRLTVSNILVDKEILLYDAGIYNRKHKVQFFPLPPKLFALLQHHIKTNDLKPEDPLLYGLKGQPLQNKQLNRITDRICAELGWREEEKVTPHGFRATIATLLDERGISHDAIKFLLGHSEKDNIKFYLRRDQRKINLLRKALTEIEDELEESILEESPLVSSDTKKEGGGDFKKQHELSLPEDILLKLLETHPQLALTIIQRGYGELNKESFPSK